LKWYEIREGVEKMDLVSFLRSVDVFFDLSDEHLNFLIENSQILSFPNSTKIIKRGDIGRFLWIIYDGKVEVSRPKSDGVWRIVASISRGQIVGEMSIVTGDPTCADVITSGTCTLIKITRDAITHVIAGNQKTLAKFSRLISRRLLQSEKDEDWQEIIKKAHSENDDPYDLNFSSSADPMKILVLNSGSSSLKYALFDTTQNFPLCEGLVERIGSGEALHKIKALNVKKEEPVKNVNNIKDAFGAMIATITDPSSGVVKNIFEINAIGHRITHGGNKFPGSVIVDDSVKESIKSYFPLAPLHNPFNLTGVELMQDMLPSIPQVAVFDTSFHHSIPESAYTYALPHDLCESEQIRRYGFHGTNHRFVALNAATYLRRPLKELKIISCHLGSGASVCAIDHGRSIDTSMGMTPLEGLIMGTRGGDIDPGAILHLMRVSGMNINEVDNILNKKSGLLGISGKSNDMREILQGAEAEDARCKTAVGAFCYRVKKYVGAYIAALGGIDAIIFTGGIGENSPEIRARTCQGLEIFGINLSLDMNRKARTQRGSVVDVSEPASKIRILVIPADEEKMIARETLHALGRARTKKELEMFKSRPIPLSISAHHVHLSQGDFESLFGKGMQLTPRSELSQYGQFAASETVNLIGPKGIIEKVRILGPFRKESQVEISRTEQFKLGIDAPIRDSGDIEGTPGIILEGRAGQLKLNKGVICAKRHIHVSTEEALSLGLRDKDEVMVQIKGVRTLIFGDVLVRVHPSFKLDMHLDTDEANAAQITEDILGHIGSIQSRQYM
jgi:acetate kinase